MYDLRAGCKEERQIGRGGKVRIAPGHPGSTFHGLAYTKLHSKIRPSLRPGTPSDQEDSDSGSDSAASWKEASPWDKGKSCKDAGRSCMNEGSLVGDHNRSTTFVMSSSVGSMAKPSFLHTASIF